MRKTTRLALALALSPLLGGCVMLDEPPFDPGKAEPDKGLLGKWEWQGREGAVLITSGADAPKGSDLPKGHMHLAAPGGDEPNPGMHLYVAKWGGHSYAVVCVERDRETREPLRREDRRYFVVKYELDGDTLAIDRGDPRAKGRLSGKGAGEGSFFAKGWLEGHLKKDGPGEIFNGRESEKLRRAKR